MRLLAVVVVVVGFVERCCLAGQDRAGNPYSCWLAVQNRIGNPESGFGVAKNIDILARIVMASEGSLAVGHWLVGSSSWLVQTLHYTLGSPSLYFHIPSADLVLAAVGRHEALPWGGD